MADFKDAKNDEPTKQAEPKQDAELGEGEPVRVNHTARNIIIVLVVVVLVAAGVIFALHRNTSQSGGAAKGSEANPVKIGVVGAKIGRAHV